MIIFSLNNKIYYEGSPFSSKKKYRVNLDFANNFLFWLICGPFLSVVSALFFCKAWFDLEWSSLILTINFFYRILIVTVKPYGYIKELSGSNQLVPLLCQSTNIFSFGINVCTEILNLKIHEDLTNKMIKLRKTTCSGHIDRLQRENTGHYFEFFFWVLTFKAVDPATWLDRIEKAFTKKACRSQSGSRKTEKRKRGAEKPLAYAKPQRLLDPGCVHMSSGQPPPKWGHFNVDNHMFYLLF